MSTKPKKNLTTIINELSTTYIPHIKSRYTISFDFPYDNGLLIGVFKKALVDINAISLDLPGYDAGFQQLVISRNINIVAGARPTDINPFQGFKLTFINDVYMRVRKAFTDWYYVIKKEAPSPTSSVPLECYSNATITCYDEKNNSTCKIVAKGLLVDLIEPTELAWSSQEEYSTTTVKLHNVGEMRVI